MKKYLFAALLIFALCSIAPAAQTDTLLAIQTATGAGAAVSSNSTHITCVVTWGGTTPTNTVVAVEGSIDNSTWASLEAVTVTSSGTMFHIVDKYVKLIRGNYVSRSGGDATTAVTLYCASM